MPGNADRLSAGSSSSALSVVGVGGGPAAAPVLNCADPSKHGGWMEDAGAVEMVVGGAEEMDCGIVGTAPAPTPAIAPTPVDGSVTCPWRQTRSSSSPIARKIRNENQSSAYATVLSATPNCTRSKNTSTYSKSPP